MQVFVGGNSCHGGSFHARMTVAAVDAIIADVMLVAELARLLTRNVLPRHIGRPRHREHSHERDFRPRKNVENTLNRAIKFVRGDGKSGPCLFSTMRGSAPERSCGQSVPRVNRTVQTPGRA